MKRRKPVIPVLLFFSVVFIAYFIIKNYYTSKSGSEKLPELVLKISDVSEGYPIDNMNDTILRYTGFTISYNEKNEQPAWVAYILTRSEVQGGNETRTENFRPDRNVSTGSAMLKDYSGSGYDRGHMAPAADMKWSSKAMSESFLLSNMSPQEQGFNRGIWSRLEAKVRDWAVENDSILVISGPVLKGIKKYIGKDSVGVPDYYYKVIADISYPSYKVISFVLPNKSSNKEILEYAVTIDSVEKITGIRFFPSIMDYPMRKRLESTLSTSLWK
jgi:endonuclease G, mitochondrial